MGLMTLRGRSWWIGLVVGAMLAAAGCGPSRPAAKQVPPAPERLAPETTPVADDQMPIVIGTNDGLPRPAGKTTPAVTPTRASPVVVDEKVRTVRIPVRMSLKPGVLEWLLSSGEKHVGMSMCVTEATPREVSEALARAGLTAGARPQTAADYRVTAPKGQQVEVSLVFPATNGAAARTVPAAALFSTKARGEPLAAGQWVYVGPQLVRDGQAEINVTDLSGSLLTTNLRDSSAMIYWMPTAFDPAAPYDAAFYASRQAPPAGQTATLEIRVVPQP
jgi:hypothetical protein